MSFNLMPVRRCMEESGEVWRSAFHRRETDYYLDDGRGLTDVATAPKRNPEFREELDMNLSNTNMALVMEALGLELSDEGALIEIASFQAAVARWLTRNVGQSSEAIPDRTSANGRWVTRGVREGYRNAQIERAAVLAREGRKRSATHILVI